MTLIPTILVLVWITGAYIVSVEIKPRSLVERVFTLIMWPVIAVDNIVRG